MVLCREIDGKVGVHKNAYSLILIFMHAVLNVCPFQSGTLLNFLDVCLLSWDMKIHCSISFYSEDISLLVRDKILYCIVT